jgi:hypothetical protein
VRLEILPTLKMMKQLSGPCGDEEKSVARLEELSVRKVDRSIDEGDTVLAFLNYDGRRIRTLVIALSLSCHIVLPHLFSVRLKNRCCWKSFDL